MKKQKTWGLFGAGFGLYGYLPALVSLGKKVVLPERYKDVMLARPDVACLTDAIHFCATDDELIRECSHIVYARRPIDQQMFIINNLERLKSKVLFLEKPLAVSNQKSLECLATLAANKIEFRLGFFSKYTAWFRDVKQILSERGDEDLSISFVWRWSANHFSRKPMSWKGQESDGGGARFFYGSHINHALSLFGNWEPTRFVRRYRNIDIDSSFLIEMRYKKFLATVDLDAFSSSEPCFGIKISAQNSEIYEFNSLSIFDMPLNFTEFDPRSNLVLDHVQDAYKQEELNTEYKSYLKLEKKCLDCQVSEFT